jgi:BASS family bile acid:Na+ symporter
MGLISVLLNVRCWILAAVILAVIYGPLGDYASILLIIVLIVQMTLSMDGLSLNRTLLKKESRNIAYSLISCFVISSGTALLCGLAMKPFFPDLWVGWVMMAATPCAVSVITFVLYVHGNMNLSVLSTTVVYLASLILTPSMTFIFAGNAISPLEIFKYVLLFILIPVGATHVLKKVTIPHNVRIIGINFMLFMMVFISFGMNRDFIFSNPDVAVFTALICSIRVFGTGFLMYYFMRLRKLDRDTSSVLLVIGVWKNTGLASALCIMLIPDIPEAALPCVISLLVETLWFATFSDFFRNRWPPEHKPIFS